jgi:hypothetical protein
MPGVVEAACVNISRKTHLSLPMEEGITRSLKRIDARPGGREGTDLSPTPHFETRNERALIKCGLGP